MQVEAISEELLIPRKCSSSNKIISAIDHASVQICIPDIDPITGVITESYKVYNICGLVRRLGESDDCIKRLCERDGIIPKF